MSVLIRNFKKPVNFIVVSNFQKFFRVVSRRCGNYRRLFDEDSRNSNKQCELPGIISDERRLSCTLIPGDGVGPEITNSVVEVFKAADVPVDFEEVRISEIDLAQSRRLDDVLTSITKNKVALKAALNYGKEGGLHTLNMQLRVNLDLYANVVHVVSLPGIDTRHKNIDCIIIREQTEGEYSALEHESVKGVVECLKIITEKKSLRIAKFAFDFATRYNRKTVTAIHKANIMKLADGQFLKCCQIMSKLYPKINFQKMIVDNATMQLVSNPHQFDVLVSPNLYGSVLDNIAVGLAGGAGVVSGASYSPNVAVFEPGARHIHATATGRNIANPTAMLLCGTQLLFHLNLISDAKRVEKAILDVLEKRKVRTYDIGGKSSTEEFTKAVINSMK